MIRVLCGEQHTIVHLGLCTEAPGMAMTMFSTRGPRPLTLLVTTFALLVVLVLFRPFSFLEQPEPVNEVPEDSKSLLNAIIDDEEARYRLSLRDREVLVRKWGPKPENVQS